MKMLKKISFIVLSSVLLSAMFTSCKKESEKIEGSWVSIEAKMEHKATNGYVYDFQTLPYSTDVYQNGQNKVVISRSEKEYQMIVYVYNGETQQFVQVGDPTLFTLEGRKIINKSSGADNETYDVEMYIEEGQLKWVFQYPLEDCLEVMTITLNRIVEK